MEMREETLEMVRKSRVTRGHVLFLYSWEGTSGNTKLCPERLPSGRPGGSIHGAMQNAYIPIEPQ